MLGHRDFAMLGEPISGREAGELGIATHVVPEKELAAAAAALARQLATGPTRSYAATRTLLKAWSSGGVAAADLVMLDVAMELYNGADAQRGFAEHGGCLRQGHRAADARVRRKVESAQLEVPAAIRISLSIGGIRATRKLRAWQQRSASDRKDHRRSPGRGERDRWVP